MAEDYPQLEEVVLGAMLHDIGKFAQRTGQKQYRSSYEELLCPYQSNKNYFSHQHVRYTDGFLNAQKNIFPRHLNSSFIVNTAAKHHKPDTTFEWIVTIADWLSAGSDRMRKNLDEQSGQYYKQPLKSVFSKIHFDGRIQPEAKYYELEKLSPQTVFPKPQVELGHKVYEKLWLDFENDLTKLQEKNYSSADFFTLLDNILLHYTWAIPSSTMDEPDISLYDHLLTTAALSAALYRYHEDSKSLKNLDQIKNYDLKKFLFVSGDLSGIQDYIFKSSETRAKILRAKSFEIQAFSEAVARYMLQQLHLPPVCKIMDAGGRFLLLLPNTEPTKQILHKLRDEVEEWAAHKYFGQLTLNISKGVQASGADLNQRKARRLFAKIAEDTGQAKQTKLQSWLNSHTHILEKEYQKIHSNQDVCPVCGKRAKEANLKFCKICHSQIKFGERIPKNRYLAWIEEQPDGALNLYEKMNLQSYADLRELPEYTLSILVNQYNPRFGTLYTPYHLPLKDNGKEVMDFTEIAAKAEGKSYLAMLMADVDNLGYIFSSGMGGQVSLSRYASLSRMLNFYFSACINQRLKTDYPSLYTVFSGGDDLCLIGPWDHVLDFVGDLQAEFTRYTGNNASITLSCGMALAGAKVPIHNMAENARSAEEIAKQNKPGKMHVFNTTTDTEEYKNMLKAAQELDAYMNVQGSKRVSSQLVYRLLDYARRKRAFEAGYINKENALWRSQFKYDTARNIKDNNFRNLFQKMVLENINYLEFLVSYALFKNRNN